MEPSFTFLAELSDPMSSPSFELRMVLVLPAAGRTFQCFDLLQAPKLLLRRLAKKLTSAAFTDQAIDLAYERFRNHDVSASSTHSSPIQC
jgi:hypothetical protein